MSLIKQKIEKVVINTGIGRLASSSPTNFDTKILPQITEDFAAIAGQKPTFRPAKKSIAGFKLREGAIIGLKATLRGKRMEEFLYRLIKISLPRIRDFRGIDLKNIDKHGNLTIGIHEIAIFPEITPDITKQNLGIQITIVPKDRDRTEAIKIYKAIDVPLKSR